MRAFHAILTALLLVATAPVLFARAQTPGSDSESPAHDSASESDEDSVPVVAPHTHAIYTYPYAIVRRGVILGYEYAVPDTRLGLLAEYGFERRARGDYRSTASSVALGWRFYVLGRTRFGHFDRSERACVGLFIGGRGLMRIAGVRTANGRESVGRATRLAAEGQLGFRFPIREVVELSLIGSGSVHIDVQRGLAAAMRPAAGVTMTVGMLL